MTITITIQEVNGQMESCCSSPPTLCNGTEKRVAKAIVDAYRRATDKYGATTIHEHFKVSKIGKG